MVTVPFDKNVKKDYFCTTNNSQNKGDKKMNPILAFTLLVVICAGIVFFLDWRKTRKDLDKRLRGKR